MYEVIAKRKVALDQLRDGLKVLGILDEMQKYPQLFVCLHLQKIGSNIGNSQQLREVSR